MKNTTESINSVANGIEWRKGDKIVTTLMEHHSNLIPWQRLNQERGIDLAVVKPDREGTVRASVCLYNTAQEVDKLIMLIDDIARTAEN